MKLNYFDFGVCYGRELSLMEDIVIPSLSIKDYTLFGFEPCQICFNDLVKKYATKFNINIINAAISNHNGTSRLYHSYKRRRYTPIGNSLFDSKNDVKKDDFEEVNCILFSEWLFNNVPNYKDDFNIIRSNIEGAEWYLFNDLKDNNLFDYIDIFCGSDPYEEMSRVKELQQYISELRSILDIHKIKITTFIDVPDIDGIKLEIINKIGKK